MAVLPRYPDFRWRFARKVTSTGSYTFVASSGTITRSSGSFVTDGIEANMSFTASGTTNNDDILFTVDSVAATTITLTSSDGVTNEGPVSCTLTAYHVDPDGQYEFPGPTSSSNLVRANSFNGGLKTVGPGGGYVVIDGIPYEGSAYQITANDAAADASPGVDEYDWYLSQRSDDSAKQYFSLTQKADESGDTYSGTVTLLHTALATTVYGVSANNISVDAFVRLFANVHVYCKRLSDGAIQWSPLFEAMLPK